MSPKQPMQLDDILEEIKSQINFKTPLVVREAIAVQIFTAREARQRIETEGSVVRDTKGSVIPHPALKIEADAIKIYVGLMSKYHI